MACHHQLHIGLTDFLHIIPNFEGMVWELIAFTPARLAPLPKYTIHMQRVQKQVSAAESDEAARSGGPFERLG